MENIKIALFDEVFEFFSVRCEQEILDVLKKKSGYNRIFLFPSLSADFAVRAYRVDENEQNEYYTPALSAAAFLVLKRGLPFSEIIFDTPHGNIKVFCTDCGVFSLKICKCKQLLTYSTELQGCDVKCTDFEIGSRIRAIHAEDMTAFKEKTLSEFVMLDMPLASAVVVSSSDGGYLEMNSYTDFSLSPPPNILLYSAAAYNERILQRRAVAEFKVKDKDLILTSDAFSVTVTVKPRFYT